MFSTTVRVNTKWQKTIQLFCMKWLFWPSILWSMFALMWFNGPEGHLIAKNFRCRNCSLEHGPQMDQCF